MTASQGAGPGRRVLSGRVGLVLAAVLLLVGGTSVVWAATHQQTPPTPSAAEQAASPLSVRPSPPGPTPTPAAASPGASPVASAAPSPSARSTGLPASKPVSLRIPSIKVDSVVRPIGKNADGTIAVPQPGPDYDKAAWYRYSPTPGEPGPSIIEGHIDSAKNGPSVFFELGRVQPGQQVEVKRADGRVAVFEVTAVRSFAKDAFPTLEVYGNTAGAALRLITCGGTFDRGSGHYTDNIVVFADMVSVRAT